MNKTIFLLFILIFTSNVNAFDYRRCMDVKIEHSDYGGMEEVFSQLIRLDEVGRTEDINFSALGYLSTTVDAYMTGFNVARVILGSTKFSNKESEMDSKNALQILSSQYTKSLLSYSDFINKNIVFVKNQSIRDDLKAISRKNALLLQKMAACSS